MNFKSAVRMDGWSYKIKTPTHTTQISAAYPPKHHLTRRVHSAPHIHAHVHIHAAKRVLQSVFCSAEEIDVDIFAIGLVVLYIFRHNTKFKIQNCHGNK